VRLPLVWLLVILGLGLALRWLKLDAPLQLDEFGPLYAVAHHVPGPDAKPLEAGTLPSKDDPLVPVGGWGEVSSRSVLPFGIADPFPLYHWLLYAVVQTLPIAEWSLRLPSLLAGLGCIAAMYYLVNRLLGAEAGLAAALLTAVDPFQVEASAMARPYALANLACVLSFLALLGVLHSRRLAGRLGWAVLYGLTLALQGYFNPVLLLCVAAHVGLLAYWLLLRRPPEGSAAEAEAANAAPWAFRSAPRRPWLAPLWWLAGCGLAAALLLPKGPYLGAVRQFGHDHTAYLSTIFPPHLLLFFLFQDGAFLVALLAAAVAGYAASQLARGKPSAAAAPAADAAAPAPANVPSTGVTTELAGASPVGTATQPAAPAPAAAAAGEQPAGPPAPWNPDLLWLGLCWLLLPQLAAEFVALGAGQPVLFTKYLSYTSLGGVVLLAYLATRVRSRDLRLTAVGVTAAVLAATGLTALGGGYFLTTPTPEMKTTEALDTLERDGKWRPDDLILYRSAFIEADLLPSVTDPAAKAELEGVIAAPLSTLYVGQSRRPFVALSLANSRGPSIQTDVGCAFDPATFYTPELADRVGRHTRYWVCTPLPRRRTYLSCLLPWLANATGWDLRVSRLRGEGAERHFILPAGIGPDDFAADLDDAAPDDFAPVVLVQCWAPSGGFAPALRVSAAPEAHFTVPVWLGTQCPTPRLTARPEAASDGGGGEGP
jgi:hypothetical protein